MLEFLEHVDAGRVRGLRLDSARGAGNAERMRRGVWLMVVTLMGCAQSHSIPVRDFEWHIANAYCQAQLDCPARFRPNRDDCIWNQLAWTGEERRLAVAEGRAVLHQEALAACLAEISCGPRLPTVCRAVVRGLTPPGGPCADDAMCGPDLRCLRRGGCGTCEPFAAIGEPCINARQCQASTVENEFVWCDLFDTHRCVLRRVVEADLPEGADCSDVAVGDWVTEVPRCAPGLGCAHSDGSAFCEPIGRAEGNVCGPYDGCDPGLVCGGRCVPGALVTEAGEPCNSGFFEEPWLQCDASRGLVCIESRCAPIPSTHGAPCFPATSPGDCTAGLLCGWDFICRLPGELPDGAPCVFDIECASRECSSERCLPRVTCG